MRPTFDDKDAAIRQKNLVAFDDRQGPRVGDFIIFADGVTRRISHKWDFQGERETDYQTSDGGSWYFGEGYCEFSGGLYGPVPESTLTPTEEKRDGAVWFFHHNFAQADNGVHTTIPFRVYTCSLPAPR